MSNCIRETLRENFYNELKGEKDSSVFIFKLIKQILTKTYSNNENYAIVNNYIYNKSVLLEKLQNTDKKIRKIGDDVSKIIKIEYIDYNILGIFYYDSYNDYTINKAVNDKSSVCDVYMVPDNIRKVIEEF